MSIKKGHALLGMGAEKAQVEADIPLSASVHLNDALTLQQLLLSLEWERWGPRLRRSNQICGCWQVVPIPLGGIPGNVRAFYLRLGRRDGTAG